MSSERSKETKEKIIAWLKEEAYSPEETSDPNAYFNILAKIGGMGCNVVQNVKSVDSFIVGTNLVLVPEQLDLLKGMGSEKRKAFFWDLRMSLLKNSELGDFQIKPTPPNDTQSVFISSRKIFYDGLTKGTLEEAIHAVIKAVIMVNWMLQQYAGIITPHTYQKPSYST